MRNLENDLLKGNKGKAKIITKPEPSNEWGNESTIKLDSTLKDVISPDQSIDFNNSDGTIICVFDNSYS